MLPYRDTRLTRIALVIFFVGVLGYAYFEARGLLFGPVINVPSRIMNATDSPYIMIQGQADRIASLMVDGQSIQVTETGGFQDPFILVPGVNRIVLDAKDKYGNGVQKVIEVLYTPSASSTLAIAATATSTTTTSDTTNGIGTTSATIAPGH